MELFCAGPVSFIASKLYKNQHVIYFKKYFRYTAISQTPCILMPPIDDFAQQSVNGWATRGWLDIIEDILETCKSGALKTRIMYRCNLNSKQITQYIGFLQSHNLIEGIESSSERIIFKTTNMGRKYVLAYNELKDVLKQQD
jgi:predicted transcriptional regulator